jgi:pre-mRNA-processing factor 40
MTKQSTWEKPEDLQTPEEKILKDCPWKEYTTPEGKTYYSNVKTKETVWEIPKEYKGRTRHIYNKKIKSICLSIYFRTLGKGTQSI